MIYLQLIIQIPIFENNFKNTLITDITIMKRFILISTFACLMFSELFAAIEIPSTQGSEFYFSFPRARAGRSKEMSLTVVSHRAGIIKFTDAYGTITAKNFNAGKTNIVLASISASASFENNANGASTTIITGDLPHCYTIASNSVQNTGYMIETYETDGILPQKVSLYTNLSGSSNIGTANIYSTETLGNSYNVISHSGFTQLGESLSSEALIVATEDNTVIEIAPTCLLDNQASSDNLLDTITIALNKGQTYQLRALGTADLTGTLIRTKDLVSSYNICKKIAVFGGVQHAYPGDYEYEQLFPSHLWGSEYVIAPPEAGGEVVRIVASSPNTELTINGQSVTTLNEAQYYDYIDQNKSGCHVQTNKPVGVAMFTTNFIDKITPANSDASMTILPPVGQMLDSIIFTTPATGYSNFLNIVSFSEFKDNISVYQLNNGIWNSVTLSAWTSFSSTANFMFMNLPISEGYTYKIISQTGGFNAYLYGLGTGAEYSYSLGASAAMAKPSFSLNGIPSSNLSPAVCVDKAIDLAPSLPAGMLISKVEWDYESDGIIDETSYEATNFKVSHSYYSAGIYKLTMIVHKSSMPMENCWSINTSATDTVSAEFWVKLYIYETPKPISLNKGDSYKWELPSLLSGVPAENIYSSIWTKAKATGNDSLLVAYNNKLDIDIPSDYGSNINYWRRSWDITNECNIYIDSLYVTINTNTGIENSKTQSNTISIFPNPADDILNVALNNTADKFEIKDMLGNTLISEAVTEKNIPIDIKQLASGVYILNVIDNGKSQSIRFIKK